MSLSTPDKKLTPLSLISYDLRTQFFAFLVLRVDKRAPGAKADGSQLPNLTTDELPSLTFELIITT